MNRNIMNNVPFFRASFSDLELNYIKDIFLHNGVISGDGKYTKLATDLLSNRFHVNKVLLTTSGTTSLELAIRLLNLPNGSEVICPSYTFSSTANAILMASNLKVVFADIHPKTLNIDPEDVAKKITKHTKLIMLVHYAGVSCDFDAFNEIIKNTDICLIEDAAQAIDAKWKNRYLGTIGKFGCLSFHETKNIVCGEGGALFINVNHQDVIERAEILREKGTNRSLYFRGQVDKYTWVDIGSSYLPSDILAAILYGQLQKIDSIQKSRMKVWNRYNLYLSEIAKENFFSLPFIPSYSIHNAHMFYIICSTLDSRNRLMKYMRDKGIMASFHYIPLDTSPQGKKLFSQVHPTECKNSSIISDRILRLPIYAGLSISDQDRVIDNISKFFLKEI